MTRVWVLVIGAFVVILDQVTKSWVNHVHWFWPNGSETLIPGFFSFTYVRNTGGAFGIFDTAQSGTLGLAVISLAAAAAILIYAFRYRAPLPALLVAALGLALGGAVGNLIDRVRLHYVIDYLDVYVGIHHWPVFNVADTAICTGVGLLALHFARQPSRLEAPSRPIKP